MPSKLHGAKVGLLIGSNCPKALEPMDILASANGGPYALKTFAGWAIVGPLHMTNTEQQKVDCNRIAAFEVGSEKLLGHHFAIEDKVKEIIVPLPLNKMFELDFHERFDEKNRQYSQEDKKFLKIVHQGIARTNDNHYEIPLPFSSDDVCFPDNREQVLQRACWLKRKFTRNSKFYEDYVNFMNDIIRKGFARKVPEDRAPAKSGQLWYIPHHGVYHPRKPKKIRVSLIAVPDLEGRL